MHHNRLYRRALMLGLACALLLPASAQAQFHLVSRKSIAITVAAPDQAGAEVVESHYIDRVGSSAFDRIGLHRLLAAGAGTQGPVLLFLPGTNMNGELPLTDPSHWLPLFLALHGVDVWSLDYRTHFVPPDTPPASLAALRKWNIALFGDDIGRAAAFIAQATGRPLLFVAGFSRGAQFAYLFAASHPGQVQGLIILDGYLFHRVPGGNARARSPRRYVDDIGGGKLTWDKRKALLEAVVSQPQGPAPLPQFHTAAENLAHVVYSAAAFGGHGGLANPQGGFSDPVVLARVLLTYDRYWPAVQDQEEALSAQLRSSLAAARIPVIAFSSTNIAPQWPTRVWQSATGSGGQVDVTVLSGWGHLDVLCGTRAQARVYEPILKFIRQHAESAGNHPRSDSPLP